MLAVNHRIQIVAVWLLAAIALMAVATCELHRVRRGELFLFPTTFDSQPSAHELYDAEVSASRWFVPALVAIGLCCGLGYFLGVGPTAARNRMALRTRTALSVVFLVATACDLFTTLWFFHELGIDVELHPGVRLLGYAYGRTAGPMIAKAVQAAGVLWLAERLPRGGNLLLAATSLAYVLAAAHNTGCLAAG